MLNLLSISRLPNGNPEIFNSLQGEGVNAGRPAIFLRLALCNLKCSWCDTKYTWDWGSYDQSKEVMEMSLADIEYHLLGQYCRYLVVTGGEPLIQRQELKDLLYSLREKGFSVEIETNGTIMPD